MNESTIPATERGAQDRRRLAATVASRRGLVTAVIFSSLALLILAPVAIARIVKNTIDPLATITDRGRLVTVTGPISCTRGEQVFLRVTLTQRTTGAFAEGSGRFACTGNDQQWEVHAATQGKASFNDGPAIAVAIARSAHRGKITDAHQWLVEVILVGD